VVRWCHYGQKLLGTMPPLRTRSRRYHELGRRGIAVIRREGFRTFRSKFKHWLKQRKVTRIDLISVSTIQKVDNQGELSQYRFLDDWQWLELNLQAVDATVSNVLPKLPSESLQTSFVGSSGKQSLREGFSFYRICKAQAETYGVDITRETQVLDFGMGWGRMLRFWLKDVDSKNLWGVDVDPAMVELCQSLYNCCNFTVVSANPPSQFEANKYSIIYAFSVFSHLSEDTARQWVAEFSRILRPGGIVVATTESRRFIKFCESQRGKRQESQWLAGLAKCFLDTDNSLRRYDKGQFLHSATGGGGVRDASFYGESLFSSKYIIDNWSKYLLLRGFIDDPNYSPQALMVLQKVADKHKR
jgi:SAM-dependent methyltransferase